MADPVKSEFARRRTQLIRLMGSDSIAILPAAPPRQRNNDVEYNYRQDSDFYYLTGFSEPEAVAVLIPGRAAGEYVLFVRDRNPEREIWDGVRAGPAGAVEHRADARHAARPFFHQFGKYLIFIGIHPSPRLNESPKLSILLLLKKVKP